jgi:hypothetical protein
MIFHNCHNEDIGNYDPISTTSNPEDATIPRVLGNDTEIPGVIRNDDVNIPGVYNHPEVENTQEHAQERLNVLNIDITPDTTSSADQPLTELENNDQDTENSPVVETDFQSQDMLR